MEGPHDPNNPGPEPSEAVAHLEDRPSPDNRTPGQEEGLSKSPIVRNIAASPNAETQTPAEDLLTTADLVKLLEITLVEIRSSHNLAFSVLAFSVAAGAIMQKIQNPDGLKIYGDRASLCWGLGVVLCVAGVAWIFLSSRHQKPLEDFIDTADSQEPKVGLETLKGALGKAVVSLQKSRRPKWLVLAGAAVVLISVLVEIFEKYWPW